MLISSNWLQDLIPNLTASPPEIAELLTSHSFETKTLRQISIDSHVTIAKIEKLEQHPNADRLRLATINTGANRVTVVCGADNIKEKDMVPYSPPGSHLFDENGKKIKVAEATIRDITSPGMLNSPRELDLGDLHTGIYILPPDAPVGEKLNRYIPTDVILEADITPNRAHDCLSHLGIAREVAAILNLKVAEPNIPQLTAGALPDWRLDIEDPSVLRYIGMLINKVTVAPSPLWLQARLWSVGSKPINNVVDITNYVLFEIGNPTHAFDANKLPDRSLGVRYAQNNEHITTLDQEKRSLTDKNLIITSSNKPIAIAGIMGGLSTEVEDITRNIFLETATFASYPTQLSSAALKLDTESSIRFKKDLSPALAASAAARAGALFKEITGGTIAGIVEHYPQLVKSTPVAFDPNRVSHLAGAKISKQQVRQILERLGFAVNAGSKPWLVKPPELRLDIAGEHDLAEEVIRLFGLEKIAALPPAKPASAQPLSIRVQWREQVRDLLAAAGGTELYNYTFEDDNILSLLEDSIAINHRIRVSNPPAPKQAYLRTTLLPRLLQNVLNNKSELKKKFSQTEKILFEISTTFHASDKGLVPGVLEKENVAVVLVADKATLSTASGFTESIQQLFSISAAHFTPPDFITFNQSSTLGKKAGMNIVAFELSLDHLIDRTEIKPNYQPVGADQAVKYQAPSKYPPVFRDVSMLVSEDVTVEQAQEVIERAGGSLVLDVDLFDEYQPSPDAPKGLAFHIAYQAPDRTLSHKEITQIHNKIVRAIKHDLSGEIRD